MTPCGWGPPSWTVLSYTSSITAGSSTGWRYEAGAQLHLRWETIPVLPREMYRCCEIRIRLTPAPAGHLQRKLKFIIPSDLDLPFSSPLTFFYPVVGNVSLPLRLPSTLPFLPWLCFVFSTGRMWCLSFKAQLKLLHDAPWPDWEKSAPSYWVLSLLLLYPGTDSVNPNYSLSVWERGTCILFTQPSKVPWTHSSVNMVNHKRAWRRMAWWLSPGFPGATVGPWYLECELYPCCSSPAKAWSGHGRRAAPHSNLWTKLLPLGTIHSHFELFTPLSWILGDFLCNLMNSRIKDLIGEVYFNNIFSEKHIFNIVRPTYSSSCY